MTDHDNKLIRNSTAEFLIFTSQAGEQSIEARYEKHFQDFPTVTVMIKNSRKTR